MSENSTFNVGDTVRHNSGTGPTMTIARIEDDGRVTCSWYEKGKFCDRVFPAATLHLVDTTGVF